VSNLLVYHRLAVLNGKVDILRSSNDVLTTFHLSRILAYKLARHLYLETVVGKNNHPDDLYQAHPWTDAFSL
jgi:hypothetical protein